MNFDKFLRVFLPFVWNRRIRASEQERQATWAKRIETMNSMGLEELVAQGFVSEKDGRMIRELQDAVKVDSSKRPGLGSYHLNPTDSLTVHATFAGRKPQCWAGYYRFNLRHSKDIGEFQEHLSYKVARSMVFHATVNHSNSRDFYKSTMENFAAEDFQPELTFLKIFDRYEGYLSNG